MKQTASFIKILLVLGVLALAGFIFVNRSNQQTASTENGEVLSVEEKQDIEDQKAAVVQSTSASRYVHPTLGFSFDRPAGYSVGVMRGGEGDETLLVQPESGQITQAFQIYISAPTEPVELTPEFITASLPQTTVVSAVKITLDGASGIMFSSNNPAFNGKSFEIWFMNDGLLYQITSYKEFSEQLQEIIGTWHFTDK